MVFLNHYYGISFQCSLFFIPWSPWWLLVSGSRTCSSYCQSILQPGAVPHRACRWRQAGRKTCDEWTRKGLRSAMPRFVALWESMPLPYGMVWLRSWSRSPHLPAIGILFASSIHGKTKVKERISITYNTRSDTRNKKTIHMQNWTRNRRQRNPKIQSETAKLKTDASIEIKQAENKTTPRKYNVRRSIQDEKTRNAQA